MSTKERSTVEVLRAARERISDPERWCRQFYAADASGRYGLEATDPQACRWCARGALLAECGIDFRPGPNGGVAGAADQLLVRAAPGHDVLDVNDTGTHADVLALYDRAIKRAEAI